MELHKAVRNGEAAQVKRLLEKGANLSARMEEDWTALHVAAYMGFGEVCTVLIREKAEVTAVTETGQTPLHLAAKKGHFEAARAILMATKAISSSELKEILDAGDADGMTALHYATDCEDETMAELLLSYGASPTLSNHAGDSAFTLAADNSLYEILREHIEKKWGSLLPEFLPQRAVSAPILPCIRLGSYASSISDSLFDAEVSPSLFQPIGFLGKGAFGEVFLVKHKPSGELFALKSIEKGRDMKQYLQTERNVLARLDHPFIVRLHSAFQTASHLYLVVDYCAGGDLSELIAKKKQLSEDVVQFYTAEIVLAVEALHNENVLYRDLKPENIVLDAGGHIRLTDFGLAKEAMTAWAMTRSFCGPQGYFPPEMVRQQGHGRVVDWYMLGCLMYEMLTGVPPFRARESSKLFDKIQSGRLKFPRKMSLEAKDLIQRLLHIDSEERLGRNGADEIKTHPFFEGVDWDRVLAKEVRVPLRPNCKQPSCLEDRKVFSDENEEAESHVEGWNFSRSI